MPDFNAIQNQKYFIKTPFVLPSSVVNALPSQITTPIKTFGGNILKKQLFKIFGNIKRGQAKDNTKVKSELNDDSINDFNNKLFKNDFNDFKKVQYLKLSDIDNTNIIYNIFLKDISFDCNFNNNLSYTTEGNRFYIERTKLNNINYNVTFTFLSPSSTTFKNENKDNVNVSNTYNLSGLEHTPLQNKILIEDFLNQNRGGFVMFDLEMLEMFGYLIVDSVQINSKQTHINLTEINVTGVFTKSNSIYVKEKFIEEQNNNRQQTVILPIF